MKLAIFSAFPHELTDILKNCPGEAVSTTYPFHIHSRRHSSCSIIAVETGMNMVKAESAFGYVCEQYRPDIIISSGFGGALYGTAGIGDVVLASRFFLLNPEKNGPSSYSLKELHVRRSVPDSIIKNTQNLRIRTGSFITLSQWMEKSQLTKLIPEDLLFPICDRETYHFAKFADQHNIPFMAVRAITDRANQNIRPELFTVTDENGMYRTSRAIGVLVTNPGLIPATLELGRNASLASRNLWYTIKSLIETLSSPEN